MSVLRLILDGTLQFDCPACGFPHHVWVDPRRQPCWTWNGDMDRPTFHPSIRVQWSWSERFEERCCHFFVRDGRIEYCSDSTHALAGQTVPMPELSG